jgi:hypothetical protein
MIDETGFSPADFRDTVAALRRCPDLKERRQRIKSRWPDVAAELYGFPRPAEHMWALTEYIGAPEMVPYLDSVPEGRRWAALVDLLDEAKRVIERERS